MMVSLGEEVIGTDYNKDLVVIHNAIKTESKEDGLDKLFDTVVKTVHLLNE